MRNLCTASFLVVALFGLAPLHAGAAPVAVQATWQAPAGASVRQADWDDYCGPRCQHWRHEHWEHEQAERRREWRREHERWGYAPYRQWYGYGGDRE